MTGSNFLEVTTTTLTGSAVTTAPYLEAQGPKEAAEQTTPTQALGGSGSLIAASAKVVDRVVHDLSLTAVPNVGTPPQVPVAYGTHIGGYAKNGAILLSLVGTTPQTVDLTDLTVNTPASTAGDTVFATVNAEVFNNLGAGAVVITTGATTPAGLPAFNATSSGVTVAANSILTQHSKAGVTVDSTHKLIVCTPAATTTLAISFGGA